MSAYIENIPDTTCLLFVETEVDKRSRMYKAVKNMAILQRWNVRTVPSCQMGGRQYWQRTEKR